MDADDIVYIQWRRDRGGRGIGIVVDPSLDAYVVHQYALENNAAIHQSREVFDQGDRKENYRASQRFVRRLTGKNAISYDPGDGLPPGPFSSALETAVRNHLDMS